MATKAYAFKVEMLVQILSKSDDVEEVRAQLDQQGGFVSARTVEFLGATEVQSEL